MGGGGSAGLDSLLALYASIPDTASSSRRLFTRRSYTADQTAGLLSMAAAAAALLGPGALASSDLSVMNTDLSWCRVTKGRGAAWYLRARIAAGSQGVR